MVTTNNYVKNIIKAGIFIFLAFIVIYSYPTQNNFKYSFEIGKPWGYGLMTAPFDFPIYKDASDVEAEQALQMERHTPYFAIEREKLDGELEKLDYLSVSAGVKSYLFDALTDVYNMGIVSIDAYNKLVEDGNKNIIVIDENRMTHEQAVSATYTSITAYEKIMGDAPLFFKSDVKGVELNSFLSENLVYDDSLSVLALKELMSEVSLTYGVVENGVKIIDRGEVVNADTYRQLNSLKIAYEENKDTMRQSTFTIVGESLLVVIFVVFLFVFLYLFRPSIFSNIQHLLLITLLVVMMVVLASATVRFTEFSVYLVPFALLPIIVRVFFDSDVALFAHIVSTVFVSVFVPIPFEFIILQLATGITAVSSLKDMTQRSQLAQTALWIFVVYSITYVAFHLISHGDMVGIMWQPFVYFAVSSLLLLLAYALIYVFEKMFGLTSSVTLVELTNVNSDLMIRFSETAPGTFQHSLQVSNLATAAAKQIDANSLLVRTGALYHDIGKMANPDLFIENQKGGENALLDMDLGVAARQVTSHVVEGVKIAKKEGLPRMVIDFIETHHGNGKVKYFYNTFRNMYPDKEVNEEVFSYPGPLPSSKETAILMMADTVEACSRTLTTYTEESIDEMVDKMIDMQILDGMFKLAPITFEDVEAVKRVFKDKIKSMYHSRIEYPELEEVTVEENGVV